MKEVVALSEVFNRLQEVCMVCACRRRSASHEGYLALPEDRYSTGSNICYRIQLVTATIFLFGGMFAATTGIPAAFRDLAGISLKMTAGINIQELSVSDKIEIDVEEAELYKHVMLGVGGLLSIAVSAGMLLAMACTRCR